MIKKNIRWYDYVIALFTADLISAHIMNIFTDDYGWVHLIIVFVFFSVWEDYCEIRKKKG